MLPQYKCETKLMCPVGVIPTKPFSVFVFLYDGRVNDCISKFSRYKGVSSGGVSSGVQSHQESDAL